MQNVHKLPQTLTKGNNVQIRQPTNYADSPPSELNKERTRTNTRDGNHKSTHTFYNRNKLYENFSTVLFLTYNTDFNLSLNG